ncbi:hypothetical protein FI667_g15632, partial [Globisporangium splendens]
MDANGHAEATTPPTGNCRFYAVAEAMLQIVHDNKANEKLLGATANRIKQSMNAAARFNFDLEFPEGTHLGILEALGRGDRKMSPKERRADVLDYFSDIASSSSSRSSTLPGSLWGGPESLRMAAKALQRKIFVLIETIYGDREGFAIYKPQSKVNAGGQFLTAKEHARTGKEWEDGLRQDRIEAEATNSPLPIVLKFENEHYISLHFRAMNESSLPANLTGTSLSKHLQGSERSKTEFKTDRSGQFDSEPVKRIQWRTATIPVWERPHHVLNHLRGPALVDLTQVLREQVIEEGLKRLAHRTDQAETRVWITGWFDRIATATTKQQQAALLNSKEDWSTLGKVKYGGLEVLRLCHPIQQEKFSRYIICTVVYEEELQTFRSSDVEDPDNLYEATEDSCAMLKQTREVKAAFKNGEELSEWSALSVIMAQLTMEVDSVEPSRKQGSPQPKKKADSDITGTEYGGCKPGRTNVLLTISETQLIEESKWTNRTVAIKSKGVVWINVYALNKKSEREHFFRRLNEEFGTHRAAAVLGGDFNCVLNKQRDWCQRGVLLPVQCESAELRRLVTKWNIHDARELVEDPEWSVQREPTEHFTRWRKNSASRLDRFYIAGNLGSVVQWEAIELPKRYSDHQVAILHMEWTSQPQRPRKVNKYRYLIRTLRPDLVRTGVQKAIAHELELMQSEGPIEWSHLEQHIVKAILRVSRVEKWQVRRYRQKLEDQKHRPANRTRRQLIEEQANAAREAAEFKFAQYLVNGEPSAEWEVKSGIRQGCTLAPLLFVVAAEILTLAGQQDPHLEGIRVTRPGAELHLISTFVDDSAVSLKQGRQLPRLM